MSWPNRGASYRPTVMGRRGVVASAHPLASIAGLSMLQRGGNAIDAAVATAAALNVVEPYMSGLGGCGYMLVYLAKERRLRVLDYMGLSASAANPSVADDLADLEHSAVSTMVPGACSGWLTALEEYGALGRADVLRPAIEYAEDGVPLTTKNAYFYRNAHRRGHFSADLERVFLPNGTLPASGEIVRQELLAATYRTLVESGQESFYRGELARRIIASLRAQGGILDRDDLADYRAEWQEPIGADYRGYHIACPPPPCSGIQYLETFNILEGFDLAASGQNSAATIHLFVEAMKPAVADRIAYSTVPQSPVQGLLSKEYAAERRPEIDPYQARISPGERYTRNPPAGAIVPGTLDRLLKECTTHFSVVDSEGNAVAVTQSLGDGFGSGKMAGEAGFVFNNLGYWYDLDTSSPNVLGPRKKIEMCMSPAAIMRDDSLFMMIGTPGSFGILQTTPQMISNVLDHGFSIQAAIEAPRVRAYEGVTLEAEARIPKSVRDELIERGHTIRLIDDWSYLVGGGQGVMIDPDTGARMGGADPRRDGYAVGW